MIAALVALPPPTEVEIDRQAAEDDSAWSDEELARAVLFYPPPTAEQVKISGDGWD